MNLKERIKNQKKVKKEWIRFFKGRLQENKLHLIINLWNMIWLIDKSWCMFSISEEGKERNWWRKLKWALAFETLQQDKEIVSDKSNRLKLKW